MCSKHYLDWYANGEREEKPPKKISRAKKCSVRGCRQNAIARGYCTMHYKRVQRHGTP